MHRIVAAALATAVLVLSPTAPALADDDFNTGTLTYSLTVPIEGTSQTLSFPVECSAGVCVMEFPDPEVGRLVFTDGLATVDIPDGAWDCNTTGDSRGLAGEFRLTDTRLIATYGSTERVVNLDCSSIPNGTVIPGSVDTLEFDFAGGRVCLIDGSCEAPTAEETFAQAGGSLEPGARNDLPLPAGGGREFTAPTKLSLVSTLDDLATEWNLLWAAAVTVVLFVLVAIPVFWGGGALNRLVERARAASRARRGTDTESTERGPRGWGWAAGGVAAAAVITSFNDPNLGPDAAALRLVLTNVVAFAVSILGGWAIASLLVRAVDRGAAPTVRFSPFTLLAVVVAVVVTRLADFEPTLVYGFVGAVAFSGGATAARTARAALLAVTWAFVVGVGAWFLYSALDAGDPGLTVVRELLAAVALAGIAATPFSLLPIPGFPGARIWTWRKLVWLPVFLVSLFAFVFLFLPMPSLQVERLQGVLLEVASWLAVSVLTSIVGIVLLIVSASLNARDRRRARA